MIDLVLTIFKISFRTKSLICNIKGIVDRISLYLSGKYSFLCIVIFTIIFLKKKEQMNLLIILTE